ncbi:MAG: zinc-dependent alcohol dehydrogenase family protein [Lawsonibacter sp.]
MKGSFYLGDRKFAVRELSNLTPQEGEVRIRVAACGVCGTDVHIYHGGKGSAEVSPPVVLGHEFSGVVEEIGPGVDIVAVGDRVTVDPNLYCGKCHYCQSGKKQLCTGLRAYGVNENGGFAQACVVKQEQCYKLSPTIPLKYGAMAEPLACAIHGVDQAKIRQGDTVCVLGGGAMGLIMVQLAKMAGASLVMLSEPVSLRREVGLKVGADAAVDPIQEDLPARVKELTGLDGVDVVIECVGNRIAMDQAFQVCKRGTTVLLFAVHPVDEGSEISPFDIYNKELTIVGSMINPDTHGRAVALINSGRLQLEPLLTHSFPIVELEQAILTQMGRESIKVLVEPADDE